MTACSALLTRVWAVELGKHARATCVRSVHRVPSLSWIVERTSERLLPEHAGKSGPELAALRRSGARITETHTVDVLCVTGDTQIETFDREPRVRRVLPELRPISIPMWLITHRELNTSRRIRVVFDLLAEELRQPPARAG